MNTIGNCFNLVFFCANNGSTFCRKPWTFTKISSLLRQNMLGGMSLILVGLSNKVIPDSFNQSNFRLT